MGPRADRAGRHAAMHSAEAITAATDLPQRCASDDAIALPEGNLPLETFKVFASSRCVRRYVLDGYERVAWRCQVLNGYDVVVSSRISCAGLQRGADRSRIVAL